MNRPTELLKPLNNLLKFLEQDRKCSATRELTKIYEENVRGTLSEVLLHFQEKAPKGEFVLVVEGLKAKTTKTTVDNLVRNSNL